MYGTKGELVHRVAARLWLNYKPESGLFVLHKCDRPACFNPKHLFIGTQKDNMSDCSRKGRISGSKKTSCPKGHPYEGTNLIVYFKKDGRINRTCRTCVKQRQRDAYKTERGYK
jgi:hypothetical protein